MAVDWTNLQPDLLDIIAKRLPTADLIRFGKVCRSWRSTARSCNREICVPWLMLTSKRRGDTCKFFNPLTCTGASPPHKKILPQLKGKRCLSSRGWLMLIGDGKFCIVNFLSGNTIQLPGAEKFRAYWEYAIYHHPYGLKYSNFIDKFVLSEDPSSSAGNYIVMVLCESGVMYFWQPGDEAWTMIDGPKFYRDIIHYTGGRFICINAKREVVICDFHVGGGGGQPEIDVISQMPTGGNSSVSSSAHNLYIVEYAGNKLFVVDQDVDKYAFDVNAFDFETHKWTEMKKSLGNRSLFVGFNSSFSVGADEAPWVKPNSIYFADNYPDLYHRGNDVAIYNMEDGSTQLNCFRRSYDDTPRLWVHLSFSLNRFFFKLNKEETENERDEALTNLAVVSREKGADEENGG